MKGKGNNCLFRRKGMLVGWIARNYRAIKEGIIPSTHNNKGKLNNCCSVLLLDKVFLLLYFYINIPLLLIIASDDDNDMGIEFKDFEMWGGTILSSAPSPLGINAFKKSESWVWKVINATVFRSWLSEIYSL